MSGTDSVAAVLDRLGTTVLSHEAGPVGDSQRFEQVAMIDVLDDGTLPACALVLGVGIRGSEQILARLARTSRAQSRVLVVRAPADVDDAVRECAAALTA